MKLSIKNLSTGYSGKTVLKDLNLQAQSGDFIVLLGKNGAGKSTLIKTLSGIISYQSGDFFIDDIPCAKLSKKEWATYVSVVLTDRIDIALPVREFIGLGRQAFTNKWDMLSKQDKEVVNQVIEQLHITNYSDKQIDELSDGERQKVLIARALVQETPVILLDEPTAHLDLENKAIIFRLLKELAEKQNKIIIVSTHDINLILPVVDKIWLANNHSISEINSNSKEIIELFDSKNILFDRSCGIFKLA